MTSGPFSVTGEQIARLAGADFTRFINRLLEAEAAAQGMARASLAITYQENVADGGVDASLRQAIATRWVPVGDSAWQFKAGDLPPSRCKHEIAGAVEALSILRDGGAYRLVLGRSLNHLLSKRRREALESKLAELGVTTTLGQIEVFGAEAIAEWVEQYPSLAIDPLIGGTGLIGQTFTDWSRSARHGSVWEGSESRDSLIETIRELILGRSQTDLHLEGASGLGKTRLVMEAIRGQDFEPLVVYGPAADQFPLTALLHLQNQNRTGVIVIDECDRKNHELFASVLTQDTNLRLLTIGEPSNHSVRTPMINLPGLEDEAMSKLLQRNQPTLWAEASRVVVKVAAGNVDYALNAARAVLAQGVSNARGLITEADVSAFIAAELPDGGLFLASGVLALLSRVGFDADVANELQLLAEALPVSEPNLRSAARALESQGHLNRQGRYRSVTPQPVALLLATRAWEELGETIVAELMPSLNDDQLERLFRRAAELGDSEFTLAAVERALAPDGVLGTWNAIATLGRSRLLQHFAVLAPRAAIVHLESLIQSASIEDLAAAKGVRRDLVWTIEKLAWHRATFEGSADLLLRLSLAENESYANNATGTWIDLFGTMLPATAASPASRMQYLSSKAVDPDPAVRANVVKAAARALESNGSIMVSGELQGGVVVEPRGIPGTYGEAWEYQIGAMDILRRLADDENKQIAEGAFTSLVSAIHSSLPTETLVDHLGELLNTFDHPRLRVIRLELAKLGSLFRRVTVVDRRPEGLARLAGFLPEKDSADGLWELTHTRSWDTHQDDFQSRLLAAFEAIGVDEAATTVLDMLHSEELPAAYEVGRALAQLLPGRQDIPIELSAYLDQPNGAALVGYLNAQTDAGDENAYDIFIDAMTLAPSTALRLTVSGPQSERAAHRVAELIDQVPVRESASLMWQWSQSSDLQKVEQLVAGWLPRIDSQSDYNAVIDFAMMRLHGDAEIPDSFATLLMALVSMRIALSEVGQQAWDWTELTSRLLQSHAANVLELLAGLIETEGVTAYPGSDEHELLQAAIRASGAQGWMLLMDRIAGGAWHLGFACRGWLANSVDIDVAMAWVGDEVDRARVLASVASVGNDSVSEVGAFLLDHFGDDEQIQSSLAIEFTSGSWTGNRSDHLSHQIAQVEGWVQNDEISQSVKRWARELLASLETQRRDAIAREAEFDW